MAHGLNGTADRMQLGDGAEVKPPKPTRVRPPRVKPDTSAEVKPPASVTADPLLRWARSGVFLTLALSALLNGYANAEHARPGLGWAGWGLGLCVPGLVLILARVSGGAYLRGRKVLGSAGGLVCLGLLALSVRHCAHTFGALTGADTASAVLWALGVDAGLVVCELVTLNRRGK